MSARFEIVRTDAGWFARFVAANHKEVWRTSETYARKRGAENAVEVIGDSPIHWGEGKAYLYLGDSVEVRYLDERTP